jgi:PAS domain S-box-containing protein
VPSIDGWLARLQPTDRDSCGSRPFGSAGAPTIDSEFRIVRPGGVVRWLANKGEVFADAGGGSSWAAGMLLDITAIREAQRKSATREGRYRALAAARSASKWRADRNGAIVVAPAWGRYAGEGRSGPAGGWLQTVHPDDAEIVSTAWREAVRIECDADVSFRVRHHTGEYRWVRARAAPVRDAEGAVTEWVGWAEDIHECQKAKTGLRNGKGRLEAALETGHVVTWEYDPDTGHVALSENARSMLGFGSGPLDEMLPLMPSEDGARMLHALRSAAAGEGHVEVEFRIASKSGAPKWFLATGRLIRNAHLGNDQVVGIAFDVTARKAAEAEARTAREALRDLAIRCKALEAVTEGILWTAATDGKLEDSASWRTYTGQTADEARGWGWLNALHPADRHATREIILSLIDSAHPQAIDYRIRSLAGEYRWFRSRAAPLLREDGSNSGWLGVALPQPEREPGRSHAGLPQKGEASEGISGTQVRAARSILRWSVCDLAAVSGVSASTIRRMEAEDGMPQTRVSSKMRRVRATLEEAGIRFGMVSGGRCGVGVE